MDFIAKFNQILEHVYGKDAEVDPAFRDHLLVFFHSGIGVAMDHLSQKASENFQQLNASLKTSIDEHQAEAKINIPKPTNVGENPEVIVQ